MSDQAGLMAITDRAPTGEATICASFGAFARRHATGMRAQWTPDGMARVEGSGPAAAWPGHADPMTGDVAAPLRRAADTT